MGKAIIIASGKGGTGKTTAVAAISSCLASAGYKTLCIDADAGLKNLDLCLGLSDVAMFDFGDVIHNRCSLGEAVVTHPDIPRLFFLTAPPEPVFSPEEISGLSKLISFAKNVFDFCIIDAPAGLVPGFSAAAEAADSAVIISASDPSSCRDSARVVMELEKFRLREVRLIINRVRRSILFKTRRTIDDAVDSIGARLIGVVPEDRRVILALNSQKPLLFYKDSPALAAFGRIARRINGEKVSIKI